jgi:glycosyltransferase involved in cell wall biosynthesis
MTAHHSHELPFHGRRLLWPERLCAGPLSDHIIAPSREVARTLMSLVRVPENKIEIVHHGFDLDRLDPRKIDGARVRRELGLDGKLVFGAIGRIYRLKNYAALIEAFATGLGAVPQTCLVIVGPGDRRPLSSLASTLGIGDRVFLIGPRSDVPDVLAAFDAFVHPAIAESFGMVIVEAMAMGRPVLSTPVGIAREVITPPQNGLLSASPEPEALAVGLRALLELRPRWAEIGAAARRRVEGFTAEAMAKRHQELYVRWLNAAGHDSMSMIPDGSR